MLKAYPVVARVIPGGVSACLADWRKQRFIGDARSRSHAPACPGTYYGPRPLCASSVPASLGKEPLPLRLTTGAVRDPQTTGWQALLSRFVYCADRATPVAGPR